MSETYEKQMADSDVIFTQVSAAGFDNFAEANRVVVTIYVPDMSVSRAGISHALKRLEKYYAEAKS